MTVRSAFLMALFVGLFCGLSVQDRAPELLPFPAGYGRQPVNFPLSPVQPHTRQTLEL
jgi:hypothetical protein